MGKGSCLSADKSRSRDPDQSLTWNEIRNHKTKDYTWIVIEGKVYDVTKFKERHPGGMEMIEDHSGQDATVSEIRLNSYFNLNSGLVQVWTRLHFNSF